MRRKRKRRKILKPYEQALLLCVLCIVFLFTYQKMADPYVSAQTFNPQPYSQMYSLLSKSDKHLNRDKQVLYANRFSMRDVHMNTEQSNNNEPSDTGSGNTINSHGPEQETNQVTHTEKKQSKQTDQKIVYLTFDDGPTKYTTKILETLHSYNAKATFFMLEPNMKRYPNAVKETVEMGNTPALHGVTHNAAKIYRSGQTVVNEMITAQNTLRKITGVYSTLIRTPYGSAPYMKPEYKKGVAAEGFQLWDWTIDSEDWKYTDSKYVDKVIKQLETYHYNSTPIVILLHDRNSTSQNLPKLLTYLQKKNYKMNELSTQLTAYHF